MVSLKRRVFAEIIGTYFLCLAVSLPTDPPAVGALSVVFLLIALIYAFAPISGAHLNPAITLGLVLLEKAPWSELLPYVAAQIVGALLAGLSTFGLVKGHNNAYPKIGEDYTVGEAIIAESVGVCLLLWCAFHTATTKAQQNNSYFGVAVAFVVLSGALTCCPVSGAAFNIVVALLGVFHGYTKYLWAYVLGSFIGCITGVGLFYITALVEYVPEQLYKHHYEAVSVYITETAGTAFLAFAIGMAPNAGEFSGVAIGVQLVALTFTGAATSGAHFNPAVTLGIYLRATHEHGHRLLTLPQVVGYMTSQLLGSFIGGTLAYGVMQDTMGYPAVGDGYTWPAALLVEILYTSILVLTILHVTTTSATRGNSYFGIAVGLVAGAGAYAIGGISGAALNPAIGMALPALAAPSDKLGDVWIYAIAPLVGAAVASVLFAWTEERIQQRRYSVLMHSEYDENGNEDNDNHKHNNRSNSNNNGGGRTDSHTFAKFMPSGDGFNDDDEDDDENGGHHYRYGRLLQHDEQDDIMVSTL